MTTSPTHDAPKIKIDCPAYNHRRYGKPWIAEVTFAADGEADYRWGTYVGDDQGGVLMIQAAPGAVVAVGQKDHRRPDRSQRDYHLVREDGTLGDAMSKVDAFRASV